ncbi:hypothetical protein B7494_g778 [Chlorociboria aeruginascens]|nr:hypothetical protein B7494_g778 [Chlorociboria aeruginascens]
MLEMSSGTIATVLVAALFSATHASYSSPNNNFPSEPQQLQQDLGVCVVYTVVEQPVIVSTCVPKNTVIIIDECTTTITITDAPTCVLTTLTISSTLTPPEINNNVVTPPVHIGTNTEPVPPEESCTTESNTSPTETPTSIPPTFTPPPPETTISSFTLPPETSSSPFTQSTPESSKSTIHTNFRPVQPSTIANISTQFPINTSIRSITPPTITAAESNIDSTTTGLSTPISSTISNDGSCGNGVTCFGSIFGDCCSASFSCGDGEEFCLLPGCQLAFGICYPSVSASVSTDPLIPTSSEVGLGITPTSALSTTLATASCNPPSAFVLSVESSNGEPYYLYDSVQSGDDYLELTHDLSIAAVFSLTDDLGTPNQLRFAYLDTKGNVVVLYSEQDIPGAGNQPVFFATAEFYKYSGFVPVVAQINPDCTISLSLPFNGANIMAVCPGCAGCIPPVLWLLSNDRSGCEDIVLNIGTPPLPTPTSALPSSTPTSDCVVAPPGKTPPGTATRCCEFIEIQPTDSCISLELQLGLDTPLFVALNPNIDSTCSNLLVGSYYCIRGIPDPIYTSSTIVSSAAPASSSLVLATSFDIEAFESQTATDVSSASPTSSSLVLPTSFNIEAFDSGTAADGALADGGSNSHEYVGFNLPFGEEVLLFNYDNTTGYINVADSPYILHAETSGPNPPVVITNLLSDDPYAFPLVCSISSNLNLTCTADNGLYHTFQVAPDPGSASDIVLALGDGTGNFIAPVSLVLVNGNY